MGNIFTRKMTTADIPVVIAFFTHPLIIAGLFFPLLIAKTGHESRTLIVGIWHGDFGNIVLASCVVGWLAFMAGRHRIAIVAQCWLLIYLLCHFTKIMLAVFAIRTPSRPPAGVPEIPTAASLQIGWGWALLLGGSILTTVLLWMAGRQRVASPN